MFKKIQNKILDVKLMYQALYHNLKLHLNKYCNNENGKGDFFTENKYYN